MKELAYNAFKYSYPELHDYFCFLTEGEIEKGNFEAYEKSAKSCNHMALAKLIYHCINSIDLDFVKNKRAKIAIAARNGNKDALKQIKLLNAAELRKPMPWRPNKIPEAPVLRREYASIIIELQKLTDPTHATGESLFNKFDTEFYRAIREIYKSFDEKVRESFDDPSFKAVLGNEYAILRGVEEEMETDINNQDPSEFAKKILARKYGAGEESIRRKLRGTFIKSLESRFPKIDTSFVKKLIDEYNEPHAPQDRRLRGKSVIPRDNSTQPRSKPLKYIS